MTVLLNHELHEPGGDISDELCDRLLVGEENAQVLVGEPNDVEGLRERMLQRLTPSMIDSAVDRFRAGLGRGILLWREDASLHFVPEAQVAALSLDCTVRRDIFLILGQYAPDSEAVVLNARRNQIELLHLGPGYAQQSWGSHSLKYELRSAASAD